MAPPEAPTTVACRRTRRARPAPVIPDQLRPRWRDLPALARLTVRRLKTRLHAVPVLGRVGTWYAIPLVLLTLVCAHADRHLAAHDRHAVVWIRPLNTTGRSIYTFRELLINTAVALPPASTLLVATATCFATQVAPPTRAVAFVIAAAIVTGIPLTFFTTNRCRDLTTRTSPQHRRLAAHTHTPLVAAQGFVADTTTRSGITLLRALRAHADRLGVGIAAVARDEELLDGYRANGFIQTEPDPTSRLLYRPPNAKHRIRAGTPAWRGASTPDSRAVR